MPGLWMQLTLLNCLLLPLGAGALLELALIQYAVGRAYKMAS